MKKDVFNGKIRQKYVGMVKFTIIIVPIVLGACGIGSLLVALFYEKVETAARLLLYFGVCIEILGAIIFPPITLKLIKIYPKHRKIIKLFLQEYVFNEIDNTEEG